MIMSDTKSQPSPEQTAPESTSYVPEFKTDVILNKEDKNGK